MPSNSWTICVICRRGWRGAPTCGHLTRTMTSRFRIPRRRDDRAWKLLAQGDANTEAPATTRHYRAQADRVFGGKANIFYLGLRGFWIKQKNRKTK